MKKLLLEVTFAYVTMILIAGLLLVIIGTVDPSALVRIFNSL